MTIDAITEAACAIADKMFVNGAGEEADRLMLTTKSGKDLGGWCKDAVIGIVGKTLMEMQKRGEL